MPEGVPESAAVAVPPPCPLCDHGSGRLFTAEERMFGWGDRFQYQECFGCGALSLLDVPASLDRYYPADYYSLSTSGPPGNVLVRRLRAAWLQHRLVKPSLTGALLVRLRGEPSLPSWLRDSPFRPEHRLLDVGTGAGHLLLLLQEMGFTRLEGIDPYLEGDLHHSGITVRRAHLGEVTGAYDGLMFHHSLEHMAQPGAVLRQAEERLVRGGWLLVRVPVAASQAWRTYGEYWVQLDAPRHLHLHTEASLRRLGEEAGLQLEEVRFDSWSIQFWGSEQYRRGIPLRGEDSWLVNPDRSPFTAEEIAGWEREAEELNRRGQGDQACFYFRKP